MEKEYNTQLSAQIPVTLKMRLEAQARRLRISASKIVNNALEEYLPKIEKAEGK